MSSVDPNRFEFRMRLLPEFEQLLKTINRSSLLIEQINQFNGLVTLTSKDNGIVCSAMASSSATLAIASDYLDKISDPVFCERLLTLLSCEIDRTSYSQESTKRESTYSALEIVQRNLHTMGNALVNEYLVARQLKTTMWHDSGKPYGIKNKLDQILEKYQDNADNPAFRQEAVSAAAEIYANMPSVMASKLTNQQLFQVQAALATIVHGYDPADIEKIDWDNVTWAYSGNITGVRVDFTAEGAAQITGQIPLLSPLSRQRNVNEIVPAKMKDEGLLLQDSAKKSIPEQFLMPAFLQKLSEVRREAEQNLSSLEQRLLPNIVISSDKASLLHFAKVTPIKINIDQPALAGSRLRIRFEGNTDLLDSFKTDSGDGIFRSLDSSRTLVVNMQRGQAAAEIRLVLAQQPVDNNEFVKVYASYQSAASSLASHANPLELTVSSDYPNKQQRLSARHDSPHSDVMQAKQQERPEENSRDDHSPFA